MTVNGSGNARSAITSASPPRAAIASSASSTSASMRGTSERTIAGLNAFATSRRRRSWSGGSRSSIERVRCSMRSSARSPNCSRCASSSGFARDVVLLDRQRRVAQHPEHVVVAEEHPAADAGCGAPGSASRTARVLRVRIGEVAGLERVERQHLRIDRAHGFTLRPRAYARPVSPVTTETVLDGLAFPEGPRWHDGRLWFSDQHTGRVRRARRRRRRRDGRRGAERAVGPRLAPRRAAARGVDARPASPPLRRLARSRRSPTSPRSRRSTATTWSSTRAGRAVRRQLRLRPRRRRRVRDARCSCGSTPTAPTSIAADDLAFPNGAVITPDGATLDHRRDPRRSAHRVHRRSPTGRSPIGGCGPRSRAPRPTGAASTPRARSGSPIRWAGASCACSRAATITDTVDRRRRRTRRTRARSAGRRERRSSCAPRRRRRPRSRVEQMGGRIEAVEVAVPPRRCRSSP